MKKTILFLVMAVALTTSTLFAQVPSYVSTDGLVAYYPFIGNANDATTNGNNGVVNGASLTTDKNGNSNSAYLYNGSSNNIGITQPFLGGIQVSSFSFYTRFKTIGTSANGSAYNIWGKSFFWGEVNFGIAPNNTLYIIWANSNGGNTYTHVQTNTGIIPETWTDAVITFDNSTIKIYINGILQATTDFYGTNSLTNFAQDAGSNKIGSRISSGQTGDFFNGVIDDFGIWNRALTQEEITNIYNSSLPQTACLPANVPTTGLVGYWPFCGNANDESGNANNGTSNGATLTSDRFGNANSAYNFSGGSSVSVPMTFLLHNLPVRTFSCWFNANGAQNGGRIYETTYLNGGIAVSNGNILDAWYYNGTNECNVTNIITGNLNEWHNLVYVTDSNTGLGSIYLDGVFIDSRNGLPFTSPSNWLNNFLRFGLGAQGESFIGKIDDIGIWNRALTPQEITNLYNVNQCITNITVTDTLIINVGQLSFNDPVAWANNITIAPNPASSQININFNNITNLHGGTLKIINSLGQQVATTPITTSGTNSTMQLATWGGTGMYFVQILNPQGQIVDIKKILLQ
ncbi:MAG: LamG-like jellyroll fold domain-containing protein [Bacteroidia bacterium]